MLLFGIYIIDTLISTMGAAGAYCCLVLLGIISPPLLSHVELVPCFKIGCYESAMSRIQRVAAAKRYLQVRVWRTRIRVIIN
jgi:hypothetical protein